MAKQDFCFTYYDGDATRDTSHMNRLERGAYHDLIISQRKFGRLTIDQIKKILGKDFADCWPSIELVMICEDGKYFIEWLETSENKAKKHADKQSENGKQGGRPKGPAKVDQQKEDWKEMISFFDNSCVCCGYKFPDGKTPTKDHIKPKNWGGGDEIFNLQPLCKNCNSSKWADHDTDYRLKFLDKIPEHLKRKWFLEKPNDNFKNPKGQNKKPLGDGDGDGDGNGDELGTVIEIENFLVVEMQKVFQKHNPHYKKNSQRDFPALLSIAKFLAEHGQLTGSVTENKGAILAAWDPLCSIIVKDKFYSTKPLSTISNQIQEITQIALHGKPSGKTEYGTTARAEEYDKLFAERYKSG